MKEEIEVYSCECPKCGYRWKVPASEWAMLSSATGGKTPRCPKCNSGRVLWRRTKKKA